MEKIRQLLVQCGLNEEAATKICEAFEAYRATTDKTLGESYAKKLEQAKSICEKEVKEYKIELARRVQIFCESQSSVIESTVAKQAIQKDTEAVAKLNQIYALLEGIETNGAPNGELKAESEKQQRIIAKLEEDRKKAIAKANHQTQLAESVLRRNRQLERKALELTEGTVRIKTITESKSNGKRLRLDEGRSTGKPTTTRPTLRENQERSRPAADRTAINPQTMRDATPAAIAEMMDS